VDKVTEMFVSSCYDVLRGHFCQKKERKGETPWKLLLGIPRRREDNIRKDHRVLVDCEDRKLLELAQDRVQRGVLVRTVLKVRVLLLDNKFIKSLLYY
jgi:hypothetical protein